jgi:hypothetical protein
MIISSCKFVANFYCLSYHIIMCPDSPLLHLVNISKESFDGGRDSTRESSLVVALSRAAGYIFHICVKLVVLCICV